MLELGYKAQRSAETLPKGRIGFDEMPDLAQLDCVQHALHRGGNVIE
ncbi:MAG: hypothetical protein WA633_13150 [Stellaceae bacterium]